MMEIRELLSIPRMLEFIFKRKSTAKILLLIKEKGKLSATEISELLRIPLATVYKYLKELEDIGLVKRVRTNGKSVFVNNDFKVTIRWRINDEEKDLVISSKNFTCFLAIDRPEISYFIGRRGLKKFLDFAKLYEDYVDGKLTVSMMAKALGVTTMEVAVLLSEVEAVATV